MFTRNDYANWSGFGAILLNELIPFVEGEYSVCANPANRALGGLSMGGMQTINFGLPNADKFHYLMPSSPAPGIQGESQLFPDDGALAQDNLKLIFFTCGSGEVGSYGCNNVDTVRGYSETNGLENVIEEFIIQGGGHNAATWRPSFWNYAQLAHRAGFTTVGSACGGGGGGMGGMGGMSGAAGSGMAGMGMGGTSGSGVAGTGGMGMGGTSGSGVAGTGGVGVGGMTAGAGAGGANGGSGMSGGSGGNSGGLGGAGRGAGGAAGGTSGSSAQGASAGMSGSGMTGGAPTTGGTTGDGGAEPPVDDGGCACSLPGTPSRTSPFGLLAATAAVALLRGRARGRRSLRS